MRKYFITLLLLLTVSPCHAGWWKNMWSRPDEQAATLLNEGKAQDAAQRFENTEWQAVSHYRAGNYEQASQRFSETQTARNAYNKGNALAHLAKYEEAIQSYEAALKLDPKNEDAQYNLDLLKKIMQKQKQQNQSQKSKPKAEKPKKIRSKNNQKNESAKGKDSKQQKKSDHAKEKDKEKSEHSPTKKSKNGHKLQEKEHAKNNGKPTKETQQQRIAKSEKGKTKEQQSRMRWLKQIPDDPGGLLRQKFLRDYQRRHQN